MHLVRRATVAALVPAFAATMLLAMPAAGPPFAPLESMRTVVLEPGYRIDLVASEPDIQSPVAMDIDERGRLFVVEMPGYPLDTRPTGRVKLLEDTDGDGRYDRSRVFADRLVLPTGVMRWKRGVLVTSAPDLLYLEDRDDDGRADSRQVVITGFAFTNPQHMVNGPVYGLDNWIYLAHEGPAHAVIYKDAFGDDGKPLHWPDHPDRPAVPADRRGVRLRPDSGQLELLAGNSQFGHGFDAWGRYFTNDNANHARHEVIAARELARNPDLLIESAMADIPDHGEAARVFPITRRPTFELLTEAGEFTSACAITPDSGGAFPETDAGSLFVAEPVHNLVHRDVLVPSGATFVARRALEDREFLAAADSWFRPVFLYVGPDGALYVVDYYRARIEHPEWTSSDLQRNPAPLYEGQDRGRIYRISWTGPAPGNGGGDRSANVVAKLAQATTSDLVRALERPSLWWRRTAQRLLVDRRPSDAAALLAELARTSRVAVARVHALWTLDGLGALDEALIDTALQDDTAGVRENAVRLAEPRLASSPNLAARLVGMAADPDPRVRFMVLGALGEVDTPAAAAARDRLLRSAPDDPWMQIAALSAGSDRAMAIFESITAPDQAGRGSASQDGFVERTATVLGSRLREHEIRRVLEWVAAPAADAHQSGRAAALAGLAHGARGHAQAGDVFARVRDRLLALAADAAHEVRAGSLELLRLAGPGNDPAWNHAIAIAIATAERGDEDPARRADAIDLTALDHPERRVAWVEGFIAPQQPEPVQRAAVEALGRVRPRDLDRFAGSHSAKLEAGAARAFRAQYSSAGIGRFLLSHWSALTPAVRSRAGDVLLDDEPRAALLVAAMQEGRVQPWSLGFWQKQDLVLHPNVRIRTQARAILEESPERRAATVRRFAAALDLAGDPARGHEVFTRVCAQCHKLDGSGGDLGPDLATVRHRPPMSLLGDILLPSQSIAQGYETYIVRRRDGTTETGVLGSQTPTSVTLRQGEGRQVTLRRKQIASMTVAPQSTMPPDLDKVISPEQMADLLAYIRAGH